MTTRCESEFVFFLLAVEAERNLGIFAWKSLFLSLLSLHFYKSKKFDGGAAGRPDAARVHVSAWLEQMLVRLHACAAVSRLYRLRVPLGNTVISFFLRHLLPISLFCRREGGGAKGE